MSSGLEIYRRLEKMSKRGLNKFEKEHSSSRENFSNAINSSTSQLSSLENRYNDAKERAIDARDASMIEVAVAEALEAKLMRCETLAFKSSLALLRANEFYHNAMISMARDARLGIKYDSDKLDSMFPDNLREPILDALKGLRMDGMFSPLEDELSGISTRPVVPKHFTEDAKKEMIAAIEEAGGVEIFAIGNMNIHGEVSSIEVVCRGTSNSVPAPITRAVEGQAVIHNHPSGVMEASDADIHVAHIYKEKGIGVAIVDNEVTKVLWVVEPIKPTGNNQGVT